MLFFCPIIALLAASAVAEVDGGASSPGETTSIGSTPEDVAPIDSAAIDSTSADAAPEDATPVEMTPLVEPPMASMPGDEMPADEMPIDELPVDEMPMDEIPETSSVDSVTEAVDATPALRGQANGTSEVGLLDALARWWGSGSNAGVENGTVGSGPMPESGSEEPLLQSGLGGPPRTALAYRGVAWPAMSFGGSGEKHIFVIGDWGGMDGSLSPPQGRPRIIAYKGGHTSGPHVFPRTRWNRAHSNLMCSHDEFVECFNTVGGQCPSGCGFAPGIDTQPQQLVAAAFKARAAQKDPQFIINVGDNFYWGGIETNCGTPMGTLTSTARHQFNQVFEGVYNGPGLSGKKWLSVLGNHDWGGRVFNNGWDQQIAYTWASSRWVLPAPYWSQHVNYPDLGFSVDIFMLDSNFVDAKSPDEDPEHNICSAKHNPPGASCSSAGGPASVGACQSFFQGLWAEQKPWLERKLRSSKANWQIVNTHFPCGHEAGWYSKLHHGYGLDLLITGHRHDQELQSHSGPGGMTCIVSGGGGGITSEASPIDQSQWYGEGQYGFYDLTISRSKILIESINYDGKVLKTAIVTPA